jgi:hypothetical protein
VFEPNGRVNRAGVLRMREQLQCANGRSNREAHLVGWRPAVSYSYQLFERCANDLSVIDADRASPRTAAVLKQTYMIVRRRHSSVVEQLFRKSLAVCAVLQAWRADTNGHTYQLFRFRGCQP